MKNRIRAGILVLLCIGSLVSCKEAALRWNQQEVAVSPFAGNGDEIEISYPVAEGKTAGIINREIERTVSDFLGDPKKSIPQVVDSLLSERNLDTAVLHIPYTIVVNGEVSGYGKTASVLLNLYQYLGGAHGLGVAECLTFDTRTGERIAYTDLFAGTDSLAGLNRRIFAREAPDQIDGLFVRIDELPLPENAMLDSAGLHVYYNPYEIAPYSSGSTEYVIPFESVGGLLRKNAF